MACPNIITFSGNRNGMADAEGADNCVAFLNAVKAHAEDKQVTICMEYLNSKVNHKDYMFDHIAWGVDVMKRVNSPRVKILYDIYHAQIMDGDIVRNIRDHFQWIGHFHTGGNPGRHEIDDTQELNYRFIMQAIADLGYTGFVTHEYSPSQGTIRSRRWQRRSRFATPRAADPPREGGPAPGADAIVARTEGHRDTIDLSPVRACIRPVDRRGWCRRASRTAVARRRHTGRLRPSDPAHHRIKMPGVPQRRKAQGRPLPGDLRRCAGRRPATVRSSGRATVRQA